MTHSVFPPGSHVSDDRCLDLVQRLLDPEARRLTLAHLKACEACELRFQEIAASHARAQSECAAILQPNPAVVPARVPRRRAIWLLAAAVAGAAAGMIWFSQRPQTGAPRPAGVEVQLPTAQLRGAIRGLVPTAADSTVVAGLEAYNRHDLRTARRLLQSAKSTGSMEQARCVYLGAALLELGDAGGAAAQLRALDRYSVPEPWWSESRWMLAVALAQSGHDVAADSLLRVLSAQEGPVAERARAYRNVARVPR